MVMVCEAETSLPQVSVQVHVRTIVRGHVPLSVSLKTGVIDPSQLSLHVTAATAGTSASHCSVTSPGTPDNTGSVVSLMVMVCESETSLPQVSVQVHVRTMVRGHVPLSVSLKTGVMSPSQLSLHVTVATAGMSASHCSVTSPGTPDNAGSVTSLMVMVCESETSLPQESVQVHVRTMVRGHVPLSVSLKTGVMSPSQLSLHVTAAGVGTSASHSSCASSGTPDSTGSVVSLMVMVCESETSLPQVSVQVHVRTIVRGHVPVSVSLKTGVMSPSQLSLHVTAAGANTSESH